MAVFLDSAAEFKARLVTFKLDAFADRFREAGIETFGDMAFMSAYTPGTSDENMFCEDIVKPLLGDADHPMKGRLRRLFTEAYALAAADVQRRADSRPDDVPAKLPTAEREARRLRLVNRLPGLKLDGETDPSFRLMDACHDLFDANVVRYIDWADCTTRAQELEGTRIDKSFRADSGGFIKLSREAMHGKAVVQDLLAFRQAMVRRSAAFDISGVCTFEVMELWADVLLSAMQSPQIPGFSKVTLEQAQRADKELFRRVAGLCRGGVRPSADGGLPVETAIKSVMFEADLRLIIAPLPGRGHAPAAAPSASDAGAIDKLKRRIAELEDASKRPRRGRDTPSRAPEPADHGPRGSAATSKKGRGKGKYNPNVPKPLQGKSTRTADGQPICFAYNMAGCRDAAPGGRCPKGLHVCAEPGCGAAHGLHQHP